MTTDGWLTTHGRIPWTSARDLLTTTTCLWADLDGLHEQPAPIHAPPASHLWAWNNKTLHRLRIDNQECIASTLHLTETPNAKQIQIIKHHTSTWPAEAKNIKTSNQWRARRTTLYQVLGRAPLTFAQLHTHSTSHVTPTGV